MEESSIDLSVVFRQKLREKMDEEELSVDQLTEKTKLPRSSVGRYTKHSGASVPPVDAAVKLAQALGLSVEYLCGLSPDVSDKEIEACAADKTGLSVSSMSVIRDLSNIQIRSAMAELVLYDPWYWSHGAWEEVGLTPIYDEDGRCYDYEGTPERRLMYDNFPYESSGKQVLNQIFSADNRSVLSDIVSLLTEQIFLNYLNQQTDTRDKEEKAWLAENSECKSDFIENALAEYKSDIEHKLSVNRYNLSYKFQQLIDKVVSSFPVDSKYDDYLDRAYFNIHGNEKAVAQL